MKHLTPDSLVSIAVPQTLRSTLNDVPEDKIYFVNFGNNSGYAVLSADTRIPDPVISIVEEGGLRVADFIEPTPLVRESERREEIENFSFYNAEENDYYVGRRGGDAINNNYPIEYVRDYVRRNTGGRRTDPNSSRTYGGKKEPTSKSEQNSTCIEKVDALLDTKWHQSSPFNDYCPERRKFIIVGHKRRAPAGCVPLAVAQIMAYNEAPQLTINQLRIDWKRVKKIWTYDNPKSSTNAEDNKMAGFLLKSLGKQINIIYSYSWAMGLPSKARQFLASNQEYKNVEYHSGVNTDKILEMLRNRKPVFITGFSGVFGGHAWVIDGFRILINNDKNARTSRTTLLHCNFGWAGKADGYYANGVFNTAEKAQDFDDKDNKTSGSANYRWKFGIITYDIDKIIWREGRK